MKINEKIEEMQSKLIKTVIEVSSYSTEEAIRGLEQLGLNKEYASKLLSAYIEAENAKNMAKNVWNTDLDNRADVDLSTDIAALHEKESETRQYFESVKDEYALQIVTDEIKPWEINDETLNILYEQGIQENKITNPSLKIAFHYYSESRKKDIQRAEDLEKVRQYSEKVTTQVTQLRKQNIELQTAYTNLKTKFQSRIDSDEKKYQAALKQNRILKNRLKEIQKRGIFKIIKDKLTGLFGNKTKILPESISEIPDTLLENKWEEIGMQELDKQEWELINTGTDKTISDIVDNRSEQQEEK